jgi:hypothetical protein
MATIPDVSFIPTAYTDIYAATGIAAGTQLVVQNKTNGPVNTQNTSAQPDAADNNGFMIPPMEVWRVPTGTQKAWFKGQGYLAVEVM